jgi:cytidylate kinase
MGTRNFAMMPAPIHVITVEREYGSHGAEFAHDLAAHLGWRLLDSELVYAAAKVAGVEPEQAAKLDEHLDPWYYRYGKVFWHDSVYSATNISDDKIFDSHRMGELVRQEILEAAASGEKCVLVGRGAACALAGHPGCFHVFVYATMKAKREWFIQHFPQHAQHADQHLAAYDKRRAAAIRQFYQQEWNCRSMYHLQINSAIGIEAMMAAVEGAAGVRAGCEDTVTR